MNELLIGVVAHISRKEMAYSLMNHVNGDVINIDNTSSPPGRESVIACCANHLMVLRKLYTNVADHEWCIILEDDAEPIEDFRVHAAAALEYAPSPVIGFYTNRAGTEHNVEMLNQARATGTSWLVTNHLMSALAYAVRTDVLAEVIDYYAVCDPWQTVEGRFTDWAVSHRRDLYTEPRFYYTLPSMVDHSYADSICDPIVSKHIRRAWWIGVADNWDTPAIEYDPREQN